MTTFAPFTKGLTSKRTALGAAAVVLMMGLAGCNSPAPSPSGSGSSASSSSSSSATTASTTPTAAPTATAVYKPATAKGKAQNVPLPVLPAVGKTNTKEGAEAFVKYWFALLSYAYETGDTKPVAAVSGPNCAVCSRQIEVVGEMWQDGQWVQGALFEPVTPQKHSVTDAGAHQMAVQVLQKEITVRNSDGSQHHAPFPVSNTANVASVEFTQNGWTMTDIGKLVG
ncbi:DUF6318 family protein [Pseudarthrobacter sp. J1763]|uniref:DUF6318 family protein n=1 Tax=Pseudarthrobacter sp. J1763 TaxID=3420445 RepID=UPI003D268AAE